MSQVRPQQSEYVSGHGSVCGIANGGEVHAVVQSDGKIVSQRDESPFGWPISSVPLGADRISRAELGAYPTNPQLRPPPKARPERSLAWISPGRRVGIRQGKPGR